MKHFLLHIIAFISIALNLSGQSWTEPVNISPNLPGLDNQPDLCIDKNGTLHCVFTHKLDNNWRKIYYSKSTDDGLTWTTPEDISLNPDTSLMNPHIVADTNNNLYVSYDYNTGNPAMTVIYLTTYNGNQWNDPFVVSEGLYNSHRNLLVIDNNSRVYDPDIQHYDSIFTALDLEYVNYLLSNSQKTSGIISLNELLNNEVGKKYIENSDRLIAQLFINDKEKKTGEDYNEELEFVHLFQNYPNPAGNLTTIRFSLAEESIVDISLFSINGQFVKTLKKAAFNKGFNNCYVNLKDLKPGVYFYRLMVNGNTSEYKKMIISR
ncbi:MAG: T9SS type A sorting domain-containing protein [Bacteroidales bacterium]